MKAISLWQPHASLWCSPTKIHETRHWPTEYRGPLVVHAAKKIGDFSREVRRIMARDFGNRWTLDLPRGELVGIVELVDCVRTEDVFPTFWFEGDPAAPDDYWCGDFSPGRFAWKRAEFRLFSKPIPYIGRQGFFTVPDELLREAA